MLLAPASTTPPIYGRIDEFGVTGTDIPGPSATVIAQLGYGPRGSDPRTAPGWTWTTATYNALGSNPVQDEYQAVLPMPEELGIYRYTYRFSLDGGATATYCDVDGAGSYPGKTFDPALVGELDTTFYWINS
jgi:hypothetical protein